MGGFLNLSPGSSLLGVALFYLSPSFTGVCVLKSPFLSLLGVALFFSVLLSVCFEISVSFTGGCSFVLSRS